MNVEDLYWFAFTVVTIVSFFTFKLLTRHRRFFTARGVPHEKPHFLYGNLNAVLSGKVSPLEHVQDFYRKFDGERIFGFYNYLSPVFYIRDPELIRRLWVQQFDHFANHGYFLDESKDRILGNQLHLLKGDKWHQMRATLSPVFASRNVALMASLIQTNSLDLVDHLKGSVDPELEFKGVTLKHVFNVISGCAFGLDLNTFRDESDRFCQVGSSLVYGNSPVQTLKTMCFYLFPKLMTRMGVQLMDAEQSTYFLNLLRNTISEREKTNVNRPDVIQLLNRVNKGELKPEKDDDPGYLQMNDFSKRKWSDEELVAQCVSFFGTGFEGLVNLLSFATLELAANQDVQNKLLAEIEQTLEQGPLTYETISQMTYLDMVVSETLRKWPAFPSSDRECSKDYQLNEDGLRLNFRKGDSVWVSVWALHRDEQNFPEPERFDPERFAEGNKQTIRPFTYMPFGVGPRSCIGNRFALLVAKITLVDLIRNFELSPGSKLVQPIQLSKVSNGMEPEGGFWLQIQQR
ncbi:hypothetical protein quinque_004149 [Culex quinquefasciatus]